MQTNYHIRRKEIGFFFPLPFVSLSFYLFLLLSVCLSVNVSFCLLGFLCMSLYIYLYVFLPFVSLSFCLFVNHSVYLSFCANLSVCLSFCLIACLSISPSFAKYCFLVFLIICLFVCLFVCMLAFLSVCLFVFQIAWFSLCLFVCAQCGCLPFAGFCYISSKAYTSITDTDLGEVKLNKNFYRKLKYFLIRQTSALCKKICP